MDYFDKQYMEWFICNHTRVIYQEQDYFDAVGYGVWAEKVNFDFKCEMTLFANDKIRTCHYLAQGGRQGEALATFLNTNPSDAMNAGGRLNMTMEERRKMNFMRTNTFRQ